MAFLALVVSHVYRVTCKYTVVLVVVDKDAKSFLDGESDISDYQLDRSLMTDLRDLPSVNVSAEFDDDCQHPTAEKLLGLHAAPRDCICGIWIKKDKKNGLKLRNYFESQTEEVQHADVEKKGFRLGAPYYKRYFAMISTDSLKNRDFMAYFALVISHVNRMAYKYIVVLVVVDKVAMSFLDGGSDIPDDLLHKSLTKDMEDLPRVDVYTEEIDEDCQKQIAQKLQGPPLFTRDSNCFGNIGVILAWSYFSDYLARILPGIRQRIERSKCCSDGLGRSSPYFIIMIPKSCRVPSRLKDVDSRFFCIGPLDNGIKKSIAGHPEYTFKNFVHQIKNSENDHCCFCGEYATPVSCLNEMWKDGRLKEEVEMTGQLHLFTETLKSILQNYPSWRESVLIFTVKDVLTLADELFDLITKNQQMPNLSNSLTQGSVATDTRVAGSFAMSYYYNYLTIIGPGLVERIKRLKKEGMATKFFILLPYSWFCYETLVTADIENIKHAGNLEPQQASVARTIGNNCSYETAIYEISAGRKTYLACVEYCTPVQVMCEMEKEGTLADLSPVQKAVELRVLYETLNTLLYAPDAPDYCSTFELVYYDDKKEKLSTKLVAKIEEVMKRP